MDDRECVDPRIGAATEHLHDNPFTIPQVRRKPHHLNHHFVVLSNAFSSWIAHGHRTRKIGSVDLHPACLSRDKKAAYESGGTPGEHLHNLARTAGTPHVHRPGHPHSHGVTIGSVKRRRCRDPHVSRAVAGRSLERMDEAISTGGTAKDSDHITAGGGARRAF